MNRFTLNTFLLLATLLLGLIALGLQFSNNKILPPPDGFKGSIFNYHNSYREKIGAKSLKYHKGLENSAQYKAEDLCNNKYWSHDRPDGEKFSKNIYRHTDGDIVGENLARKFDDVGSVMNAWISSPDHHNNIIDSKWRYIGIGTYNCSGVQYTTVHFSN